MFRKRTKIYRKDTKMSTKNTKKGIKNVPEKCTKMFVFLINKKENRHACVCAPTG